MQKGHLCNANTYTSTCTCKNRLQEHTCALLEYKVHVCVIATTINVNITMYNLINNMAGQHL